MADVAAAEADHRTRAFLERGVDDFTALAIGQDLARNGIDDLDENLVLDDVQAVLGVAHGSTGAVDVGEAEEVVDARVPDLLDGFARRLDGAAGLAGYDDVLERGEVRLGVVPLLDGLLAELPGIGGRRPEERGLVLLHGPQQAVARDGTNPDAERAELLGADDAGAADVEREVHAVQVAIVGTHACLPEQAALGLHEVLEVTLRERAHRGNAGRSR